MTGNSQKPMSPAAGRRCRPHYSLAILFLITALSAGEAALFRYLSWEWVLDYAFFVGLVSSLVLSVELGGKGSLTFAALWVAAATTTALLATLRAAKDGPSPLEAGLGIAWNAFWGDVLGGSLAWPISWLMRWRKN